MQILQSDFIGNDAGSTTPDEFAYYSPEANLFSALAKNFAKTGQLDPEAFYLILDWKAARARKKHLHRLAKSAGSFDKAVSQIAIELHEAAERERLGILMIKWGFLLPTATAILSVLYPDRFTVYDIRVCKALGDFDRLGNMKWSEKLWQEYQRFITAVRNATPSGLTLRECDRWLWGRDKRRDLRNELACAGPGSPSIK